MVSLVQKYFMVMGMVILISSQRRKKLSTAIFRSENHCGEVSDIDFAGGTRGSSILLP